MAEEKEESVTQAFSGAGKTEDEADDAPRVEFKPAVQGEESPRPDWIYPSAFVTSYGLCPIDYIPNPIRTDYERDDKGQPRRRWPQGGPVTNNWEVDYQDAFNDWRGRINSWEQLQGILPIWAAASQEFERWGLGMAFMHRMKTHKVPILTWEFATVPAPYIADMQPEFVAWAIKHRPDALAVPYQWANAVTGLVYPHMAIAGYQSAAIEAGKSFAGDMLHPGVRAELRAKNRELRAAAAKSAETLLDELFSASVE